MQSTMRNMADHGQHTAYGNDTRHDIRRKLTDLQPFEGHSMRAEWGEENGRRVYRVWSYATIIAEWWPTLDGGTYHVNETYYTPKTQEHKGMVAVHLFHYALKHKRPHVVEWNDVWGDTYGLSDGTY